MENEVLGLADIILNNTVWAATAVFVLGYVLISIVKSVAVSIFQYIMFKTDQFGIGSVIEYKGKRYVIREIGFRRIALEERTTREWYYISTNSWMHMILIVPVDANKQGD